MKYLVLFCLPLLITSFKKGDDVKTLLCHKWIQFASKASSDLTIKPMATDVIRECILKKSGYYEDIMDKDTQMAAGKWVLSPDQKKMEFRLTIINGQHIPELPESAHWFNIIILRLTRDTLIYGKEVYNSKGEPVGHDDSYFVKE
jgi:hypothetical protein